MPLVLENGNKFYACIAANMLAEKMGNYVYSGLAVTAKATPQMKVDVASGVARLAYALKSISATEVTINAAHATFDRYDLISVSGSAVITYTQGTAEANPYPPNLPAGHTALAIIYVQANDNQITSSDITDVRIVNNQVLWRDKYSWSASTNYKQTINGECYNGSSAYELNYTYFLIPSYPVIASGSSVKIRLDIKSASSSTTAYAKIYRNGTYLGSVSTTTTGYVSRTYDVSNVSNGDVITISIYSSGSSYGVYAKDAQIGYDATLVTNE